MNTCEHAEQVCAYALQALPAAEVSGLEAHIASCARCQQELEALRPAVDAFVAWPTDVLRPTSSLQQRLADRIAADTGTAAIVPARQWVEPAWEDVAPGIACKILSRDTERHVVSMLVR